MANVQKPQEVLQDERSAPLSTGIPSARFPPLCWGPAGHGSSVRVCTYRNPFFCLGVLMCGYPDSFQARFYCLFQPSPVSSTQLPPERPDRDVPLYTSRKSLTFRCYNSNCFMEVVWGQRQEMRSPQLGTLIPRDSATPVKQTGHRPSLWSVIIHPLKLLQWFRVQFWLSQHSLEDSTISVS